MWNVSKAKGIDTIFLGLETFLYTNAACMEDFYDFFDIYRFDY